MNLVLAGIRHRVIKEENRMDTATAKISQPRDMKLIVEKDVQIPRAFFVA